MLRLVPSDAALQLQAWADRSIVEVSGQGGRAAVTARVYPTLGANSSRISVYTSLSATPTGNAATNVQRHGGRMEGKRV